MVNEGRRERPGGVRRKNREVENKDGRRKRERKERGGEGRGERRRDRGRRRREWKESPKRNSEISRATDELKKKKIYESKRESERESRRVGSSEEYKRGKERAFIKDGSERMASKTGHSE